MRTMVLGVSNFFGFWWCGRRLRVCGRAIFAHLNNKASQSQNSSELAFISGSDGTLEPTPLKRSCHRRSVHVTAMLHNKREPSIWSNVEQLAIKRIGN
jgi:hypothetical protein